MRNWLTSQLGLLRDSADEDGRDLPGGGAGGDERDEPDKGGKGGGGGKDHRDTTIAELRQQLREREEGERYWHEQAKAGQRTAEPARATDDDDEDDEPEIEDTDPSKLVDEFGVNGIKALRARGLVTKKEVKELLKKAAAKEFRKIAEEVTDKKLSAVERRLTSDSALVRDYPDLTDPKSELFERASKILKEDYADDPEGAKKPSALRSAARAAAAELKAEGRGRRSRDDEDREDRIRRQSGDRGGRGGGDFEDDEPEIDRVVFEQMSRYVKDPKALEKDMRAERSRMRRSY